MTGRIRIVHVGSFPLRAKGAFIHGVATKLTNGLIRNGHAVVNFSDRDVARASTLLGNRKFGAAQANKALIELCRAVAPELVMLGHADVIVPATLAAIRDAVPGVRLLQWNVDPLFDEGNRARVRARIPDVDASFVSTAGADLAALAMPGRILGWLPNPVDASIERGRAFDDEAPAFDLVFPVGRGEEARHHCGHAVVPDALIARIAREVPGLRLATPGMRGEPHIQGDAYQRLLETSRLGLALSKRNDRHLYASDRLAHLMGNGVLALLDRASGYDTLFGDDEIAFYESEPALVARIAALRADGREARAIAERGARRYHDLFDERRVARYLVEAVFGTLRPEAWPWPTLVGADPTPIRDAAIA
ncbi:MAG: glycosyltransferase family 1 protein [Alphaproteobacteria bacterium]|nr:glycosyltransferase family 1 protein [Alphaproteobacteria bacterium]